MITRSTRLFYCVLDVMHFISRTLSEAIEVKITGCFSCTMLKLTTNTTASTLKFGTCGHVTPIIAALFLLMCSCNLQLRKSKHEFQKQHFVILFLYVS